VPLGDGGSSIDQGQPALEEVTSYADPQSWLGSLQAAKPKAVASSQCG
jgi:hypothetical protein